MVSSSLATVGYDMSTRVLEVEFHSGQVYQYLDVPKDVFDALLGSESLGAFFNSEVRDAFRFRRV